MPAHRTIVTLGTGAVALIVAVLALHGDAVVGFGGRGSDATPPNPVRAPRRMLSSRATHTVALVGGKLIDGRGGAPIDDAVVIIRGETIVAAGHRESVGAPSRARTIDVSGATILPGFINAHVHSGYARAALAGWAREGVTTIRDLCGPSAFDVVAERLTTTRYARVIAAGPFITVPQGYPIVPWGTPYVATVTSPEQARLLVNDLIDDGADLIKISLESGQDFGLTLPRLSAAEAAAVVETAHARGVVVSAHVTTTRDLQAVLDAGADDIAHMVVDPLSVTLAQRIVAAGIIWVPTLELWFGVGHGHGEAAVANLRRFVQAGGAVALGTDFDGFTTPFQLGMPTLEMAWMRQAGMSPMDIIVAATRNAARACNLTSELGTVEAGKIADILVVTGDPLLDLDALADTRLVLRGGVIIYEG